MSESDFRLLYSLFICLFLVLNHVVGDAEGVAEVERVTVFAEDGASVFDEKVFGGLDVFDGEAWDGRLGVEVAVDVEEEVAGVVFEGDVGFADQAKVHNVGVEVFGGGDVD